MKKTALKISDEIFSIHQLSPDQGIPGSVFESSFYHISKTDDELSIVIPEEVKLSSEKEEMGWACLRISETLDFGLIGILARITSILADAKISVFAVSTFNTDYFFVKKEKLETAKHVLIKNGYLIEI